MHPSPLPPHLIGTPFAVATAPLSPARARAKDLDASVFGVRILSDDITLRTRCAMFALRLRDDAVFSHTTAALLLGAPLDWRYENSPKVHVSVAAPESSPHASGLIGHRLDLEPRDVVRSQGLRITSAERTWLDLATMLSLEDLVAVGDYFIHHRHPLMSVGALRKRLERMAGMRGVRLCREAIELLSDRPESRPESLLRLIVLGCGLPEPRINHVLVDTETGKHVRPDFIFEREKLILEYQGDYHRTQKQWRKDMTRRTRLEAQGWHVLELNWDDLKDPRELVVRIRLALRLTR